MVTGRAVDYFYFRARWQWRNLSHAPRWLRTAKPLPSARPRLHGAVVTGRGMDRFYLGARRQFRNLSYAGRWLRPAKPLPEPCRRFKSPVAESVSGPPPSIGGLGLSWIFRAWWRSLLSFP